MRILLFLLMISMTWMTAQAGIQDMLNDQELFRESYELEEKGEYSSAINVLKKGYKETSYEYNVRLGWLHYEAGLFTESIAYYNKAINLYPYAIEAKFGLAYPASAIGNWNTVVLQYEKILEIDPNNTLAHYRLGSIMYGRQEYGNAKPHFEKVVNLYPFDYDGVIMLGWTQFQLGDTKAATVLFHKALLISPDDESAKEGLELVN